MTDSHQSHLITFANPKADRNYEIEIINPEFTCLCPVTGQPDFAIIRLRYIADQSCLELKGIKLYFGSFRDVGCFHEAVTNRILDDFVAAIAPRAMVVEAVFNIRGGISTRVLAEHGAVEQLKAVPPLKGLNPAVFA
ncbi:MAG: preQ(1) synthase [Myxococcota bacterium]|nr:preQ(1) synthase [Myxococcota bacterium]